MVGFLATESARVLRGLAEILRPTQPAASVREYRIDDLAREAGVSVRNVRVYQDRGLLPPPRREGRTGWYSEAHLQRLALIGRMLDRGYTFATIGELLTAASYGMRVEEVLGRDNLDVPPRSAEAVTVLDRDDLAELLGHDDLDRHLDAALADGLLVPRGKDCYAVINPRLVDAARLMRDAGVAGERMIEQAQRVRRDLDAIAGRFVRMVAEPYLTVTPTDLDADAVARIAVLVDRAGTTLSDVVTGLLAESMQNAVNSTVGQLAARLQPSDSLATTQGRPE